MQIYVSLYLQNWINYHTHIAINMLSGFRMKWQTMFVPFGRS